MAGSKDSNAKPQTRRVDIAVAGAGLAGLTAALALGRRGFEIAVVAPPASKPDLRTTALLSASVDFLDRLGVWQDVLPGAAPLKTMRLVDDTGRLFRAPQVDFRSSEIGLAAFGYNVRNQALVSALRDAAGATGKVAFREAAVDDVRFGPDGAVLSLSDGTAVECGLAVGADGRHSVLRRASGIGERQWSYPQTAIVLDFAHDLDHGDTSTEFHTPSGPFTFVPLGERRSSLVWVERPERAAAIMEMERGALEREVETRMHSVLGKVRIESDVQAWPLSGMSARRYGKGPLVLVGESAHVFPPIGAQGFNLGIRDVELLDRLAVPGARLVSIGDEYHARRGLDIGLRTASVDLMNRSLLSGFLPVQMARSLALAALGSVAPLRRMAMREGVAPGSQLRHIVESLRRGRGSAA